METVEVRLAADRAQYGEAPQADAAALAATAYRLERDAALKKTEADVLMIEHLLAAAEIKPAADAKRAKEIDAASKQLTA